VLPRPRFFFDALSFLSPSGSTLTSGPNPSPAATEAVALALGADIATLRAGNTPRFGIPGVALKGMSERRCGSFEARPSISREDVEVGADAEVVDDATGALCFGTCATGYAITGRACAGVVFKRTSASVHARVASFLMRSTSMLSGASTMLVAVTVATDEMLEVEDEGQSGNGMGVIFGAAVGYFFGHLQTVPFWANSGFLNNLHVPHL